MTFRLSEQEYELVRSACLTQGDRSLSEFARRAVMHQLSLTGAQKGNFGDDLNTLSLRLQELDTELEGLRNHIAHLLGKR